MAVRLDAASAASAAAGISSLASPTTSASGAGTPGLLPGEAAKELSTIAARACAASLVVAARFIAALDGATATATASAMQTSGAGDTVAVSLTRASAEADAAALPALAAVERGFGGAPVTFRRLVPDALFFSLRVLRSAAVSEPLRAAAKRVAASAALTALRHCRLGAPAMRPLGAPLDAAPFIRTLLAGAGGAASEIARTAALASPAPAPDVVLTTTCLSALPTDGGGVVARVSENLIEAAGGEEAGPTTLPAVAARAAGLLDVAGALLRRSLPVGAAARAARSAATALDAFAFPLGDALALAESFCDAAAGVAAGAAAVHADAAAATLGDPDRSVPYARAAATLSLAGGRLIAAVCECAPAGARRHRALIARALLRAIEAAGGGGPFAARHFHSSPMMQRTSRPPYGASLVWRFLAWASAWPLAARAQRPSRSWALRRMWAQLPCERLGRGDGRPRRCPSLMRSGFSPTS